MAWRGVHFAIDDAILSRLLNTPVSDRAGFIANEVEANWDAHFATETDKAWSLIHSSLQGTDPESDGLEMAADEPSSWTILGREFLDSDSDCLISLVEAPDVPAVANLLGGISADDVVNRLHALIDQFKCENVGEAEAHYAGEWFPSLQKFFQRAAEAKRHVIFTVDF